MDVISLVRMLGLLSQLRVHDRWTREQLERYQQRRLGALRAFAYRHSPFYQEFHAGLYDRPLAELPVLTKRLVMDNFDALVTDRSLSLESVHRSQVGELARGYRVSVTSGSTGTPGILLFSADEWTHVLAAFLRAQQWEGVRTGLFRRFRVASVASSLPRHMSCQVNADLSNPWASTLSLSAAQPLDSLLQQLNDWQPTLLCGYPSILGVLARAQHSGHLHIRPERVFASGEVLAIETRQFIERVWNAPIFNQYGATETAVLAAECERRTGMHVMEDEVIVENVDDQNQPVALGKMGSKLLVTTLFNYTQPLIRYELSDCVTIAPAPCPCGRPYRSIQAIEGRREDILYLPGLAGTEQPIHPNVFHYVMDPESVHGWQVVLRNDGLHVLVCSAETDKDVRLKRALTAALEGQGAVVPSIHIEHVEALPRPASGKLRLVRSELL